MISMFVQCLCFIKYILINNNASLLLSLVFYSKSKLLFQAGKLNTYRFCDNVWTFMLNDVEFREVQEVAIVDKVKIVACDGKSKFNFILLNYFSFY